MAVQIIQKLLSDLSGEAAEKTTKFALDGREYTIDLTVGEDTELREFLDKYVKAGVRTNSAKAASQHALRTEIRSSGNVTAGVVPTTNAAFKAQRAEQLAKIREWAAEKGITVHERGRIPQNVVDMYENRHALEAAAIAEAAEKANNNARANGNGKIDVVDGNKGAPIKANGAKVQAPAAKKTTPAKTNGKTVPAASFSNASPAASTNGRRRAPAKKATAAKK